MMEAGTIPHRGSGRHGHNGSSAAANGCSMTASSNSAALVDLAALLGGADGPGPVWTHTSADLNINLLSFSDGQGVPEHVNNEVDVLLVVIQGQAEIIVDGARCQVAAGQACVILKGSRRAIRAVGGPLGYVSCHKRRAGLMPI
jgi:mannose-6-phosphate isomerase-like protein (cupin superfamily)